MHKSTGKIVTLAGRVELTWPTSPHFRGRTLWCGIITIYLDSESYRLTTLHFNKILRKLKCVAGFLGGSDDKESACQCRTHGFSSWVGKITWRRKWQGQSLSFTTPFLSPTFILPSTPIPLCPPKSSYRSICLLWKRTPRNHTINTYYGGARRRRWHPTPVLLPGKSYGWRSLVGCSPWGR